MRKLIYQLYGKSHDSKLVEIAPPVISTASQVLVKVKAASLNPVDWKIRQGEMKLFTGSQFPRGMGCDFSGVVLDAGSNAYRFKKDDRVFGFIPFKEAGAFADIVICDHSLVGHIPDHLSFEEASCLPMAGSAALTSLELKVHINKGDRVFIGGCTGGVGHLAVQYAKSRGAVVIGSCGSIDFEKAKLIGVDEIYDYSNLLSQNIRECSIVFDTSGKMSRQEVLKLLPSRLFGMIKGGSFVNLNPTPASMLRSVFSNVYKVVITKVTPSLIQRLAELAKDKKLSPLIGEKFEFSESIKIIEGLETGKKRSNGKVVFTFK